MCCLSFFVGGGGGGGFLKKRRNLQISGSLRLPRSNISHKLFKKRKMVFRIIFLAWIKVVSMWTLEFEEFN